MSTPRYRLKATATVSCIYAAGMLLCIGYLYLVPSIFDYWGPASEAYQDGDYEAAAGYFEKIVELRPRDSDSHFYRGYSLGTQGDYEGALASFDAALEIKPDDSRVLSFKTIALLRRSRFEEAVDVGTRLNRLRFEEEVDVDAGLSSQDSSYFFVQYALAYHLLESGDLDQAEGMLRQAVAADSTWILGYLSLECILNRTGRPLEALEAHARARALDANLKEMPYESTVLPIPYGSWPSRNDEERVAQACREE